MGRSWKLQPVLTESLRRRWHRTFVLHMTPTHLMSRKKHRVLPRGIPFGALANLARIPPIRQARGDPRGEVTVLPDLQDIRR